MAQRHTRAIKPASCALPSLAPTPATQPLLEIPQYLPMASFCTHIAPQCVGRRDGKGSERGVFEALERQLEGTRAHSHRGRQVQNGAQVAQKRVLDRIQ